MNVGNSTSKSQMRFTIVDVFRLQFVLVALLGIGIAKQVLMGGNAVVVVLVALLFAFLGRFSVQSSFIRFTIVVVTIFAGGIGGTLCGRLKFDLLEAGFAGLLVGVVVSISCHWAEPTLEKKHLRS